MKQNLRDNWIIYLLALAVIVSNVAWGHHAQTLTDTIALLTTELNEERGIIVTPLPLTPTAEIIPATETLTAATNAPAMTETATLIPTPTQDNIKGCPDKDQYVTYSLSGYEGKSRPECIVATHQSPTVHSVIFHVDGRSIRLALDRVGGDNEHYAIAFMGVPAELDTTCTMSGMSLSAGHNTVTTTTNLLLNVVDEEPVTMICTVGPYTVTANASLK